jgi:hypothetical protein
MWMAIIARLTSSRATQYLPWAQLTKAERVGMIDALMDRLRLLDRIDLPGRLAASWGDIRRRTLEFVVSAG